MCKRVGGGGMRGLDWEAAEGLIRGPNAATGKRERKRRMHASELGPDDS